MKTTQKYFMFFVNLIIVASLCVGNQYSVSAQTKKQGETVLPPLFSELNWKNLGTVKKDVGVHGQVLSLSGNMFEVGEVLEKDMATRLFEYYSSENLQLLGWNFVGGIGVDLTYQNTYGRYITVSLTNCNSAEAKICAIVWQGMDAVGIQSQDVPINALAALNKISPANGATIPLPSTTFQLLQWSDAGIAASDRYQYCIDETNNSLCDSGTWKTRNSLYSGPDDFPVLSGHTYYWQVRVRDANVYANTGAWWSFTVQSNSFSIVSSIVRNSPISSITNSSNVIFTVSFSQSVTGVDVTDFVLTTTGVSGPSISGVSGSSQTYNVTVNTGTGNGTIRLDLIDNDSIKNSQNTPLGGVGVANANFITGEMYTIDKIAPSVLSIVRVNTANSMDFTITFSEPVTGVELGFPFSDFALTIVSSTGISGASIKSISGSGATYTVSLNQGVGDGMLYLGVPSNATIADLAGNSVAGLPYLGSEAYVIQKTFDPISKWTSSFDLSHGWTVVDYVRATGDVDNDGKDDLVGFGLDGVYVALSNGTSFGAISRWTTSFDLSHGWTVNQYVRTVGDVNNDGKDDLIGFGLDGVYVATSNGASFDAVSKWSSAFDLSHGWTVQDFIRTVGDVNNDGRDDLIGFGLDGVYVALSNGTSFDAVSKWSSSFDLSHGWTVANFVRTVGDVNNDGKVDLIGFGQDGVYVALSTGSTFGGANRWTTDFGYSQGWNVNQHPRTVADVNNDGRVDVIGFGKNGVYVALSNGTSFGVAFQGTTDFNNSPQGWSVNQHFRTLGDSSGDGKFDLVGFGLDGVYIATSR